jgi:hypothetical protein
VVSKAVRFAVKDQTQVHSGVRSLIMIGKWRRPLRRPTLQPKVLRVEMLNANGSDAGTETQVTQFRKSLRQTQVRNLMHVQRIERACRQV